MLDQVDDILDQVDLGDVDLGDVDLGDVDLGDVDLGDVDLGDVDTGDIEVDDSTTLDDVLDTVDDSWGDFVGNLFEDDTCLGGYAAAVGEVGDADYRPSLCITDAGDDDDCTTCMNWGTCVAEANVAWCDEGSSAGLVVGLILAILAAVAIGIVVYCFCCKGDDDDYQKQ